MTPQERQILEEAENQAFDTSQQLEDIQLTSGIRPPPEVIETESTLEGQLFGLDFGQDPQASVLPGAGTPPPTNPCDCGKCVLSVQITGSITGEYSSSWLGNPCDIILDMSLSDTWTTDGCGSFGGPCTCVELFSCPYLTNGTDCGPIPTAGRDLTPDDVDCSACGDFVSGTGSIGVSLFTGGMSGIWQAEVGGGLHFLCEHFITTVSFDNGLQDIGCDPATTLTGTALGDDGITTFSWTISITSYCPL